MTLPSVFISHANEDNAIASRLTKRLRDDGFDPWLDEERLLPGEDWRLECEKAMRASDAILVCFSERSISKSGFVQKEFKRALEIQEEQPEGKIHVIPVRFDHCEPPFKFRDLQWVDYPAGYDRLVLALNSLTGRPRVATPLPETKISLAKLPSIDPTLFGREKELAELDEAWDGHVIASGASGATKQSPTGTMFPSDEEIASGSALATTSKINVFALIAWGGVGKSALVNAWLNQMARDNFRGAERVFGWSFYSQGAKEERQVSSEPFIASALTWFGDAETANSSKSSWEKGERLAELIRQQRTLLILDGLEPLQSLPDGDIRDKSSGLVALLRELAVSNPGLVVVSSRLSVADLQSHIGASVVERDLENLSDEAGAEYLRHLGVDGTEAERQAAAHDFGGHALALTLLGRYLQVVYRGDVRKRGEIPRVMDERKQGAHARRVMESYERWLAGKPELDILRLIGLFDRPAERGAIQALREPPAIQSLTSNLQSLSDADWQFAVEHLRELRLLAPADPHEPDTLDCHPLLREHFGEKLKTDYPDGWRQGHLRLFAYYAAAAEPQPNTIEEMAPLFAAVMHGCQAGKHQEAYDDIFRTRVRRGNENFIIHKLGALGSQLATISNFFDPPWRQPIAALQEGNKGWLLNEAGYCLRAQGRLAEAAQPMQAGLEGFIARKDWLNAARQASNLSELYLTIGDVRQALDYAGQSVGLADKSEDEFQRMTKRVSLADALHQVGRLKESQVAFQEAEEIQKKDQPELPLLYSLQGYKYCDLLLSQGRAAEIERRARQTLEWSMQQPYGGAVLDNALDNLSLGRAKTYLTPPSGHPSPTGRGDGGEVAIEYLNRAVDGLRQAGTTHHLPRGLLARAEYFRVVGDFEKAKKDLDEAFAIATRGGMRLYLADCHLGYARLKVARGRGDPSGRPYMDAAREHVSTAKEMIEKMGYHRRDTEVQELEEQLK